MLPGQLPPYFGNFNSYEVMPGLGDSTTSPAPLTIEQSASAVLQVLTSEFDANPNPAGATATNFSFAVDANQVWVLRFSLTCIGPSAGMRFQITVPSGATAVGRIFTDSIASGTFATQNWTDATAASNPFFSASATGVAYIDVTVTNGSTAGNVGLSVWNVTLSQHVKVEAGSLMDARIATGV
jgi:hypothetical protein